MKTSQKGSLVNVGNKLSIPSAHHIAISTENFGQATYNNISVREDVYVQKIANSFVNNDCEVILLRQSSYPGKVG